MSQSSPASRLTLAIVPAVALAVIFEVFLSLRHDYAGHFLARYGGTLAAYMFGMMLFDGKLSTVWIVPICVACIALGAVTEATIFRLAKFDEIDFCNQSLGAVLAGLAALGYLELGTLRTTDMSGVLIAGIVFLGLGGCFAVA